MSVKEKAVRIVTQVKSTKTIVATFFIIAGFGLISMPQMIGPANAQNEQASEHACPVAGSSLNRGECIVQPITKYECRPSSIGGVTAELSGTTCTVTKDTVFDIGLIQECEQIGGELGGDKKLGTTTCTFDATEVGETCPLGIHMTEEGECITKPGRGNDPT